MAENIEFSGYDVEFVSKPAYDFSCAICLSTMKNPVQTIPCSHQFCEGCITRHKNRYDLIFTVYP